MFVDRLPGCRQALHRIARNEPGAVTVTQVIHANILLAYEAYQTGRWDEAEHLAQAAHDLAAASHARVLTELARSDFEAAYHCAAEISPAGRLAAHKPHALWVPLDLVEAAHHQHANCERRNR